MWSFFCHSLKNLLGSYDRTPASIFQINEQLANDGKGKVIYLTFVCKSTGYWCRCRIFVDPLGTIRWHLIVYPTSFCFGPFKNCFIDLCVKTRQLPGAGGSARIPCDVLTGQSLELMLWQPTRDGLDLKTEQLLAGSFHSVLLRRWSLVSPQVHVSTICTVFLSPNQHSLLLL